MVGLHSFLQLGIFFFARGRARAFENSSILLIFSTIFLASPNFAANPTPKAITDLQSSDAKTKFKALELVQKLHTHEAGDALVQALRRETDIHLRLAILDALAIHRDAARANAIAPLLKDPLVAIRQRAAQVLGILGSQASERPLAKAIATENDPSVKTALLNSLSLCGSAESVAQIQAALSDSRPEVRANAIHALQRIPGKAATDALKKHIEKDPKVQQRLREALQEKVKVKGAQ